MTQAILRIFPHSKQEFATADDLRSWLVTALKARGGRYLLRSNQGSIPRGSVVLFRHGNQIVGEAVVEEDFVSQPVEVDGVTYEGSIKFAVSSIRLYVGGLPIEVLADLAGRDFSVARTYYKIEDWAVYPRILSEAVKEGFYS
jgi:hypothetical protein